MLVANKTNLLKLGKSLLGVDYSEKRLQDLILLCCEKKISDFVKDKRDHISFAIRDWLFEIDKAINFYGVETLVVGSEDNGGYISYINSGDSYVLTIFYYNGKLRIGCLADLPCYLA